MHEAGGEPPAAFYEQPDILPWNRFYWESFFELSTERQIGMGAGPIPRSAIVAYAKESGIDGDRYDVFHRIIRALDAEYLKLANPSGKDGTAFHSVSADDAEGVKGVFDRLGQRSKRKPATRTKH